MRCTMGSCRLEVQGSRCGATIKAGIIRDVAALLAFSAPSRGEGRAPSASGRGDTPQVLSVVALPPTRGAARRVVEAAPDAGADFILVAGDTFEDTGVNRVLVQRVADIPHERRPEPPCPRQVVRRTTLHCLERVRTDSKRA